MKYAVIQTGGKQYQVTEGDTIEIEKILGKAKDKIDFDKVLLVVNEDKMEIGKPLVKRAVVTAEIVEQKKGLKIRVAKFRAKSRYRKVKGHRQRITVVNIKKIKTSPRKT